MKIVSTILLILSLSPSINAATLKNTTKLKLASLEKIAKEYKTIIKSVDDTSLSRVSVTKKTKNENWADIISKVYLRNTYVDEANATLKTFFKKAGLKAEKEAEIDSDIQASFTQMVESGAYLNEDEVAKKALMEKVLPLIQAAAKLKNVAFYEASFSGAFDIDYSAFVIVDTFNNQILSLEAGYSE
ncbi:MAG: hypothetical protein ACOYL6_08845 [Bacteriovoracaceae bacterium]